ncbi:MAG TPA: phosphatidate cytidylyltransferase [Flavobacteriales bacterium]|nr:phosphatidate cytidylyltransferase [Flavobacteriales bacterium]HIO67738.1 phosphatidate cytidylyltransferase [Flavobacteriales bacterium]
MSNMVTRALTGSLIVATILGGIYYDRSSFVGLFFVITTFGLWEFYTLAEKGGMAPQKLLGTIAGAAFFVISSMYILRMIPLVYLLVIMPLMFLILIAELYRKSESPLVNISITLSGIFYLSIPMVLLSYLSYPPAYGLRDNYDYNPNILIGFFLILWTNDTFAYLVGKTLGKRKLFESVSPQKTWEGSFGGAVFSIVLAYFLVRFFPELRKRDWLVVAGIIVLFSNLGDLIQSKFKRSVYVKDSGTVLPGHGGILDRFDGVYLAAPFVYTYIRYLQ